MHLTEQHSQEERWRLAIEAAGLGVWDFNLQTGELYCCERCRAIFGWPTGAPLNYRVLLKGIYPEDREHFEQALRQACDPSGSGRFDTDCRVLMPDASEHRVMATGQALFATAGTAGRRWCGFQRGLSNNWGDRGRGGV